MTKAAIPSSAPRAGASCRSRPSAAWARSVAARTPRRSGASKSSRRSSRRRSDRSASGHHRRAGGLPAPTQRASTTAADNPVYAATIGAVARFSAVRRRASAIRRSGRTILGLAGSRYRRCASCSEVTPFARPRKPTAALGRGRVRALSGRLDDFLESTWTQYDGPEVRSVVRRGVAAPLAGRGRCPLDKHARTGARRAARGWVGGRATKPGSNFRAPVLALALANDDNSKRGP